uniref:Uncharacterized protein n=1 Tax=Zea mays TaxID=4577 RepID=A0A804PAJ0_MAIZE
HRSAKKVNQHALSVILIHHKQTISALFLSQPRCYCGRRPLCNATGGGWRFLHAGLVGVVGHHVVASAGHVPEEACVGGLIPVRLARGPRLPDGFPVLDVHVPGALLRVAQRPGPEPRPAGGDAVVAEPELHLRRRGVRVDVGLVHHSHELVQREALLRLLRVQHAGVVRDVGGGVRVRGLVHLRLEKAVAEVDSVLVAQPLRPRRRDLAIRRRVHPPGGGDVSERCRVVEPVVRAIGQSRGGRVQRRRVVADNARRRGCAPGVQPEVEVGVDEPRVHGVGHRERDLVLLAVQQLAQKSRELDVVGWEVERADAGDRSPEQRVDAAGVDHGERPHDADQVAVDLNSDLAERAVSGGVPVPELVLRVVGEVH